MPKFEFNLEAVLQQREWEEREKQRALAVLLGAMSELERELTSLDEATKSSNEDLRGGRLVGEIDLAFLAAHRRFVQGTERRAAEIMQNIRHIQPKVEEARRSLMLASQARKVVEKLRERKLGEWKSRMLAAEQQEADDVGMKSTIAAWQEEDRAVEAVAGASAEADAAAKAEATRSPSSDVANDLTPALKDETTREEDFRTHLDARRDALSGDRGRSGLPRGHGPAQ